MPVVITVAPTGPLATKAENPALPTQPREIAMDVLRAYELGASVAHVHLRDERDRPTADFNIARRLMYLITDESPILVQMSTGVGLPVPFEDRARLVELRPRMATLNPCSMTFAGGTFLNPPDAVRRLAARMQELGVKAELEVYDTGHVEAALRLRDEGLLAEPLQFSLVLGVEGGAPATPEALADLVRRLPEGSIWQSVGMGRRNLRLTAMGLAMGANARCGMEDTLHLGEDLAPSNGALVERTVALAAALDLAPATPAEAAKLLCLPT
jgi:3-keto-5-aminohexanoate cleavage enzyme